MERDLKYNAFVKDDEENNNGRLVNCCNELTFLLNNPQLNTIFSKHYLNEILSYASTFSEYYKAFKGFRSITDFPIVNKQFLKDHWSDIAVKQYLDDLTIKTKYTSGSTGTPFKMIMDKYKHSRWIAGNKVFRENVGVKSHEKTLYISGTVLDKNIPLERMERDNVFYEDCRFLDDNSIINLLHKLMDDNYRTMTAMASVWEKISLVIKGGKAPCWEGSFIAVFSVSEHLKESVRKTISDYFKCGVYVLYANEENGVLGVEDGSNNGCRANEGDFFFEVLSLDSDEPAGEGKIGRLVITDYFNKAFPIIRYENGDLVSWKRDKQGKLYFDYIAGRIVDILYTTDKKPVLYFNSISFLERFMDIKQFQLIQYDYHHFKWLLNTDNKEYEQYIIEECKKLFGEDSFYEFEYVTEIPKLRSGKVRMTVCKINDGKGVNNA